jgi:hypothetical protein
MALAAGSRPVAFLQGKLCSIMLHYPKRSRSETRNGVAIITIAFPARGSGKLATVRTRSMTVTAVRKRNMQGEIRMGVTAGTFHARVFSLEGKSGLGMIETCRCVQGSPACYHGVTTPAGGAKGARVRIPMAWRTILERKVPVLCGFFHRISFMTFVAGDFFMSPFQTESGGPVIKPRRLLPILRIMTAFALR